MFRETMPHGAPHAAPCFRSVAYRTFDMVSVPVARSEARTRGGRIAERSLVSPRCQRANRRRRDL